MGFVGARDGRFRLARQSRYAKAGTDGRDPGANAETLDAALTAGTMVTAISEASADSFAPMGNAHASAGYPIALWLPDPLFLLA